MLAALGVPHRLRPELVIDMGGGFRYRLRPELTFRHRGLEYAVPPRSPAQAEGLLARQGFLTVNWPEGASALNRVADLLALLGVPHRRATVEAPPGGILRLRVSGLLIDDPGLASLLHPDASPEGPLPERVLLSDARLPREAADLLLDEGILPWLATSE